MFGTLTPRYPRRVESFTEHRAFAISKARNLLGYEPSVELEEGLRRTANWYLAGGPDLTTMDHRPTEEAATAQKKGPEVLFVDGHVHLHACFPVAAFLDHAARNMTRAAGSAGIPKRWTGILLLAESVGVNRFDEMLARSGDQLGSGRWIVAATNEDSSVRVRSREDWELTVVAGRQIVTDTRLEVLALCTRARVDDGGGLLETIRAVREGGGVPVLPWGFGKWWGRRRHLIESVLNTVAPGDMLLGDNGVRPRGTGEPALFRYARTRGIPVLPGSDPLPFPSQINRAGSFGAILPEMDFDSDNPARSLRTQLRRLEPGVRSFGQRVGLVRCGWTQLRLRLVQGRDGLPG